MLVGKSWAGVALVGAAVSVGCATADTTTSSGSGGESSTNSTTTSTTSTGTTSTSTTTTTAGSGGAGTGGGATTNGSGGGAGTGGGANCTEITATMFSRLTQDTDLSVYGTVIAPNIGMVDDDTVTMEFYGPGQGSYDGDQTGTFDLSATGDDNYGTCSRCIRVLEDYPDGITPGRKFFQSGGTLVIDATSTPTNGKLDATLTDATLVEVTIDPSTFTSTPVVGGACLHVASATVSVDANPPMGWTCSATYYGDTNCDCGCGIQDLDCASTTDPNECSFANNCGTDTSIDPANTPGCICDAGTQFSCADGGCTDIGFVCDGFDDCNDGSDELNCP